MVLFAHVPYLIVALQVNLLVVVRLVGRHARQPPVHWLDANRRRHRVVQRVHGMDVFVHARVLYLA